MIAPGTLCLVVKHASCDECNTDVFGWTCTVDGFLPTGSLDGSIKEPMYVVAFPRPCCAVGDGYDAIVACAIRPIAPPGDPDAVDTRVPEETFA